MPPIKSEIYAAWKLFSQSVVGFVGWWDPIQQGFRDLASGKKKRGENLAPQHGRKPEGDSRSQRMIYVRYNYLFSLSGNHNDNLHANQSPLARSWKLIRLRIPMFVSRFLTGGSGCLVLGAGVSGLRRLAPDGFRGRLTNPTLERGPR